MSNIFVKELMNNKFIYCFIISFTTTAIIFITILELLGKITSIYLLALFLLLFYGLFTWSVNIVKKWQKKK